jgi:hypothetical protein
MEDRTFIEWDKDDIDALCLMKVDVLALGMLTCIRKCLDLIEDHGGTKYALAMCRAKTRPFTTCCAGRLGRRVPGGKPRADEHAAAAETALSSTTS